MMMMVIVVVVVMLMVVIVVVIGGRRGVRLRGLLVGSRNDDLHPGGPEGSPGLSPRLEPPPLEA